MKTTELLIPIWPSQSATTNKIGTGQRYQDLSSCDSFWLPLRAKPKGDGYEFSDQFRIWKDIGIYVWMSADYGISLEIKAHDVHSGDVRYIELLLKYLKWANKRIEGMEKFTPENIQFRLIELCHRLGIKRCVKYSHCREDEFAPVEEALKIIASEITTSYLRLRKAA